MPQTKIPENNLTVEERQHLVESNMKLLHYFAHRLCKDASLYEDMIQEGSLGLCRAAKLYNPEKHGSKFSTFASFEIQCSMKDFLFYNRMIKLPDSQRSAITKYQKFLNETEEVEIDADTVETAAKEFGLKEEVKNQLSSPVLSLNTPVDSEESATEFIDIIADPQAELVERLAFNELLQFIIDTHESICSKNPRLDANSKRILDASLNGLVNEILGGENIKFRDLISTYYPEYEIRESDDAETIAYKKKTRQNVYDKMNGKWNEHKKKIAAAVSEYRLACCN